MAGFCVCCTALKPRYKRLVDNIFPANPQDGLVKSNMEKLTFYALSSRPEKLDRIGQYLERKLSTDISRHRNQYVFISMEILDQLLVSCHAHSLNLFVESFLKMVQKLLECGDPKMQIRATQSFVKFANVEEDAPSYHRRYDFFVSKFSSLCHNNNQDVHTCRKAVVLGNSLVHVTVPAQDYRDNSPLVPTCLLYLGLNEDKKNVSKSILSNNRNVVIKRHTIRLVDTIVVRWMVEGLVHRTVNMMTQVMSLSPSNLFHLIKLTEIL